MERILTTPIAHGRTAEIYAWQDGYILKLYHEWCPPHWVEYESRVVHAMIGAGIPTPAAGEIVEVSGRRGIVFERVTGISMLQDMNARPWRIFQHARTLAELQSRINRLIIPGLSSGKDGLANAIRRTPYLSNTLREYVLHLLDGLQDGEKVCHGDFHPGNIMLTDKGAIVIDWMTVSTGNPIADFARTGILLTIGPKGVGKQVSPTVRLVIHLFYQLYSRHYLHLVPYRGNERGQWLTVVAAARLDEQIEQERGALLQLVKDGLGM